MRLEPRAGEEKPPSLIWSNPALALTPAHAGELVRVACDLLAYQVVETSEEDGGNPAGCTPAHAALMLRAVGAQHGGAEALELDGAQALTLAKALGACPAHEIQSDLFLNNRAVSGNLARALPEAVGPSAALTALESASSALPLSGLDAGFGAKARLYDALLQAAEFSEAQVAGDCKWAVRAHCAEAAAADLEQLASAAFWGSDASSLALCKLGHKFATLASCSSLKPTAVSALDSTALGAAQGSGRRREPDYCLVISSGDDESSDDEADGTQRSTIKGTK
ncbi:hypothetical protein T492DRAFT_843702 [Pavlovales sp. CCMP2436]|nr:hypothetical protein T492DRAFT_843702 [Pavlovales sp. CCMP2436]